MTSKTEHILVVDDEESLCEALKYNLEAEGYCVDTALSSEEALTLDLERYDLLLLDIMMGEISGLQLARIVRSSPATENLPIIFCTAKDTEEDIVRGLDSGADDYIAKPYSLRTALARIRSVLRRSAAGNAAKPEAYAGSVAYKGLVLSSGNKTCTVDGAEVRMPKKEFEILFTLVSNPGHVFSREELLKEIWPDEVVVLDRVVDVNITRIRRKIGDYGKNLVTRSGYGYTFIAN